MMLPQLRNSVFCVEERRGGAVSQCNSAQAQSNLLVRIFRKLGDINVEVLTTHASVLKKLVPIRTV